MNASQIECLCRNRFPSRREIALDVSVHIEEIFDKSYFQQALGPLFDSLEPAKAMSRAANQSPNIVAALLESAAFVVSFDLSFSLGIKVENALIVFSSGSAASASLFFRLNDLCVFARAKVDSVDLIRATL